MTRGYVIVEGQTEEAFIRNLVAPEFGECGILLSPVLLGCPGHRGGRVNYDRLVRHVRTLLMQDRGAFCSTMVDFYGLGPGFPGASQPPDRPSLDKVKHLEQQLKDAICRLVPDVRADQRFIPYIQLHEFEGLLFSDPTALAKAIQRDDLAPRFRRIRDDFPSPEHINDGPDTAPSKRILAAYPRYRKVIDGVLAAQEVGIPAMKDACLHFREWLHALEAIDASAP